MNTEVLLERVPRVFDVDVIEVVRADDLPGGAASFSLGLAEQCDAKSG